MRRSILCAGFFPDRHGRLYAELEKRYDVFVFMPSGDTGSAKAFPLSAFHPDSQSIQQKAHEFQSFLRSVKKRQGMDATDEEPATIQILLEHWALGCSIRESLVRFHQENSLAAVLCVNDHLAPNRYLVQKAKDLAIPTFFVKHSFGAPEFLAESLAVEHSYVNALPVCDHVCLDNEAEREYFAGFQELRGAQYELHVTGSPNDRNARVDEGRLPTKSEGEHWILFCPGWVEVDGIKDALLGDWCEHRAFRHFCAMVKSLREAQQNVRVIVKLHPTLAETIGVDTAAYFRGTAARHGILDLQVEKGPLRPWICRSDLLVTSKFSSAIWEAFREGVPTMTYLSPIRKALLKPEYFFKPTLLARWGAQRMVDESQDWASVARDLIEAKQSGEYREQFADRLPLFLSVEPEQAAVNIVELIEKEIQRKATENARPKVSAASREPLRILQVVHSFPPFSFAGTELYTLNLSLELQKLGHHVEVIFPITATGAAPLQVIPGEYEGIPTLQFNVAGASNNSVDFHNEAFDAPFRELLQSKKYNVIHFQHLMGLSGSWIGVAREMGVKTALKIDDMFFYCTRIHLNPPEGGTCSGPDSLDKCHRCLVEPSRRGNARKEADLYWYLAYRRSYLQQVFAQAEYVHSPSHFLAEGCRKWGFQNPNLEVLPTGIKPFGVRPRQSSRPGRFVVGFMGTIALRKGILEFLDAVESYGRAMGESGSLEFHIHGAHFQDALFRTMTERIGKLPKVQYHGPFQPEDRARILSTLDLLVVPSSGENYPFIIREALYAGIPVASTSIAGVPEIIQHGKNGFLFPPGSPESLGELLARIAREPGILTSLKPVPGDILTCDREALQLVERFYRLLGHSALLPAEPQTFREASAGNQRQTEPEPEIRVGPAAPRTSIVIPTFNGREMLETCISSLERWTPHEERELIIVDNGSVDGTREYLDVLSSRDDSIRVIRNDGNLGFGKACNQGALAAGSPYLLFLNNDTEARRPWLSALRNPLADNPQIVASGAKLLYGDGRIQHAGVVFALGTKLPYHIYRGCSEDLPATRIERLYKAVTGACLMLRREAFLDAGMFDEEYRNGLEDIDLCLRLGLNGGKCLYTPECVLIHHESRSRGRQDAMDANRKLYQRKWADRTISDDVYWLERDGMELVKESADEDVYLPREVVRSSLEKSLWIMRGLMEANDGARTVVLIREMLNRYPLSHLVFTSLEKFLWEIEQGGLATELERLRSERTQIMAQSGNS